MWSYYFRVSYLLNIKFSLPDSEWELWVELTVEVEHSDTDRRL